MRKLIPFSILIIPVLVFAADFEIDKGAVAIGGDGTFASFGGELYEDFEGAGITYFSIEPSVQYFVMPGLALGGDFVYRLTTQGKASTSGFGFGPIIQYYFQTANELVYPTLAAGFSFAIDSFDSGYGTDSRISVTKFRLMGGAMFKLVDHFGIEAGFFYDIDSQKGDWAGAKSESGSIFGVAVGFKGFLY